ncbi:Phosphate transport system permease protein PstC [Candidatus Rhodobacter oscarellae]|uniref:Phosphate transport system permease protein n=1 Tax=Candidatus Rhodobacter oscarellae TaxID=1675527 RepID=A0A0J9E329_9RHOB|nr:phosphate ABC transporter permease subunit PstC [Candidatus Rhodobacter lobularis]KMW57256.1 Phosphate transport system permease protein PstC [Candidatus Rhodobacter lobularis]
MTTVLFAFVLLAAVASFVLARQRAVSVVGGEVSALHSRPSFHGLYSGLWVLMAGIGAVILLTIVPNFFIDRALMGQIAAALPDDPRIAHQLVLSDAKALASGEIASKTDDLRLEIAAKYSSSAGLWNWVRVIMVVGGAVLAAFMTLGAISPDRRARNRSETIIRFILAGMATIAILTTVGIVMSLIFETLNFFNKIDWQLQKFLFGTTWSPLSGVHEGKLDADKVGAIPLFAGTLMITMIAMLVAVPVGLFAAIFLSDFASRRVRSVVKPMLEILAGIPTVVYGFFAAITVAPFLRGSGEAIGLTVASESALVAGIVMGIMIIPFISSLSDDVINSVPQSLRDGAYGLGATKAETMRQVVLPAALPGIVSAALLGFSRAVGETMIVVMAAGQGANLTANPFEAVTTVTVQIVMLITGDTEAETAAGPAFTLGFTLFCVTLLMNFAAQRLVRRYRELYD